MKTYEVQVTYEMQIEADNPEQAIDKGESEFCEVVLGDNPNSEVFHFEVIAEEPCTT